MENALPLWARVLSVIVFCALGSWLLGIGAGVAPLLGGTLEAPAWVAGLAGAVFVLCGLYIALDAAPARFVGLRHLVVVAFLVLLAVLFSWISFGEGARDFTPTPAGSGAVRGDVPEGEGRLAFGALAVLSYVLIAAACWRAWRDLRR